MRFSSSLHILRPITIRSTIFPASEEEQQEVARMRRVLSSPVIWRIIVIFKIILSWVGLPTIHLLAGDGISIRLTTSVTRFIGLVNKLSPKNTFARFILQRVLTCSVFWRVNTYDYRRNPRVWSKFIQAWVRRGDALYFGAFGQPDLGKDAMCLGRDLIIDFARCGLFANWRPVGAVSQSQISELKAAEHGFVVVPLQEEKHVRELELDDARGVGIQTVEMFSVAAAERWLRSGIDKAAERPEGDRKLVIVWKKEVATESQAKVIRAARAKLESYCSERGVEILEENVDAFMAKIVGTPVADLPRIILTTETFADMLSPVIEYLNSGQGRNAVQLADWPFKGIMRELSQGWYIFDGEFDAESGIGIQRGMYTRGAVRNIIQEAIRQARLEGLSEITVVGNALFPMTDKLWQEVAEADSFKVCFMDVKEYLAVLVSNPNQLTGVYVTGNMLGDILGDAMGGVQGRGPAGGLGILPSLSWGIDDEGMLFGEPVHGSAVDKDGEFPSEPNPLASLLSMALLVDRLLGTNHWFRRTREALCLVIEEDNLLMDETTREQKVTIMQVEEAFSRRLKEVVRLEDLR